MQKARVGPSYNCCLRAYAIAVFCFYDAPSEKARFACEVEAGDIRGIDVCVHSRYLPRHPSRTTDHCGAVRFEQGKRTGGTCNAYGRLVLTKSALQVESAVWLHVRIRLLATPSSVCSAFLPGPQSLRWSVSLIHVVVNVEQRCIAHLHVSMMHDEPWRHPL